MAGTGCVLPRSRQRLSSGVAYRIDSGDGTVVFNLAFALVVVGLLLYLFVHSLLLTSTFKVLLKPNTSVESCRAVPRRRRLIPLDMIAGVQTRSA